MRRKREASFGRQLNNARLASIATSHNLVPGFTRMLRDCDGELEKFYVAESAMKALGKEDRRRRLGSKVGHLFGRMTSL